MIDLTKVAVPTKVKWTPLVVGTFWETREALCHHPVVQTPDISEPFIVHRDASDVVL